MLGEKKDPDGYTPDSYNKYARAYAKILAWIEDYPKPETLTQERIDELKKVAEGKLKKVEKAPEEENDGPNLNDDEDENGKTTDDTTNNNTDNTTDNSAALDEAKAKAKETLGEKKPAVDGDTKYTEDSYKEYSENYDKVVAAIEGATSVEDLQEIVDQIPKLNKMLVIDDTADTVDDDTFEIEIEETPEEESGKESEEESGKESEEEAGKEPAADNKLVVDDISDEALIKLYSKVTGNMVSGEPAKRAAVLKRIRNALKSSNLGEGFNPDLGEDELIEAFMSEPEAVKSLKQTSEILKDTAASMGHMTDAMKEEYHRYANPTELKAMEDIEELITKALTKVYADMTTWGYEAEEVDSQSFMCQKDEACLQYMVNFQDLDPEEFEDLADQIQMQLENEVSLYKPAPEIRGISVSVALPDYDLADADDADEGITKASFLFYVDFARRLY